MMEKRSLPLEEFVERMERAPLVDFGNLVSEVETKWNPDTRFLYKGLVEVQVHPFCLDTCRLECC